MELALFVYAANTVKSINLFLVLGGFMTLVVYFIWSIDYYPSNPPKWLLWVPISMLALATLIPSERTMWMIAGAYGAQSVIQSEVGKKTLLLIEKKLDAELDRVIEEVKK